MILKSIKYSQLNGQNEWDIGQLDLESQNLIVGKNASGKTKTITCINNLALLMCGNINPAMYMKASWEAHFEHEGKNYHYSLSISSREVIKEELLSDKGALLTRGDNGEGEIYAEKNCGNLKFQTPKTNLAIVSRRDSLQHTFIEPFYQWASSVYFYEFGTPLGRLTYSVIAKGQEISPNLKHADNVIAIYQLGKRGIGEPFVEAIKGDMRKVGYDISNIDIAPTNDVKILTPIPTELAGLWIQENELKSKTEQKEISQGMFRVLSLIIHLNYSVMSKKASCILIDDIGEGLDFERSCALIELLLSKTKSTIQLIMTTNDRFIMNKVPLDMWTVLFRDAGKCKVFNAKNSKEIFEKFRFTGLNNFDFFAANYFTEVK